MAEKTGNRRVFIGAGIFIFLIVVNLFIRWGRTPPSVTVKPQGSDAALQPPIVGIASASSPPNQTIPANITPPMKSGDPSQPDLSSLLNTPLPQTNPIEAMRDLRSRLKQLPPILHVVAPSVLSSDPRNPFQWMLPEPLTVSVATETPLATGPIGLPIPGEKKISFAGSFVMFGKRVALIRKGDEMHLVSESESLPGSSLSLSFVSSNSALLEGPEGKKVTAEEEVRDSTGFLKAMKALQGQRESHGYPIREVPVGTASSIVEKASSSPPL